MTGFVTQLMHFISYSNPSWTGFTLPSFLMASLKPLVVGEITAVITSLPTRPAARNRTVNW